MILTGDNQSTERKNPYQCHFVHRHLAQNGLGANPGLRGDRPATNHLSHGTDSLRRLNLNLLPEQVPLQRLIDSCLSDQQDVSVRTVTVCQKWIASSSWQQMVDN